MADQRQRIAPPVKQGIESDGKEHDHQHVEQDRIHHKGKAGLGDLRPTQHHNHRCCAARRMQAAGVHHDDNAAAYCQRGQPESGRQPLHAGHAKGG